MRSANPMPDDKMNNLVKTSSSKLPTEFGDFMIHIYRDLRTASDHVALVMGNITSQNFVLTRVHSECMTGDIFSSKRCDCGEQLKLAQQLIAEAGAGIIIYLRDHEGRGIGLENKIRAYKLQDQGLDTVEANLALGLPIDTRSFEVAAEILHSFDIRSIRLLSNNPNKYVALNSLGVSVSALVPLLVPANPQNIHYLQTKQNKLGHLIQN